MLSKEQLGNILLHNYHDVLNKLKVFKELSEEEQKIILLSVCFDGNIIVPFHQISVRHELQQLCFPSFSNQPAGDDR